MKKCSKCFIELDLSSFCKDSFKRDGLASACRKCWTLENLRPLEAFANLIKGNKIQL